VNERNRKTSALPSGPIANSRLLNAACNRKYEIALIAFCFMLCGALIVGHVEGWQHLKEPDLAALEVPAGNNHVQSPADADDRPLISNQGGKEPLLASIAAASDVSLSIPGDEPSEATAKEMKQDRTSYDVLSIDEPAHASDAEAKRVAPMLQREGVTGQLVIATFGAISFPGEGRSCLEIGASMLRDLELPEEKLDVLVDTDEITLVRICAKNGSVVMSCRNDLVTLSRRVSRPDDKCNQSI
jgi:hypothetical protein